MDPTPTSPSQPPSSDQPLAAPLVTSPMPIPGVGSLPFSPLGEERTRPSALWLLIPLLITAIIGGGVWAWLRSGVPPKKQVELPPLALPLLDLKAPTPIPAAMPNPRTDLLVALPPPKPKMAPRVSVPAPRRALAVPSAPKPDTGPLQLKATFSLEGGGDPSGIDVTVFGQSQWGTRGLNPDAEGKLSVEVPQREGFTVVGKAPGYAYATDWIDLEHSPGKEAVLVLERLKRYQLDVVQFYREGEVRESAPGPSEHSVPLVVEAGMAWRGIHFSQREGELHAQGQTCVCIFHPLGQRSAESLAEAVVPPGQKAVRCFFAMRVGEAFLVRPGTDEGWVVLRLREPGVEAEPLPSTGRRVVTSRQSQP